MEQAYPYDDDQKQREEHAYELADYIDKHAAPNHSLRDRIKVLSHVGEEELDRLVPEVEYWLELFNWQRKAKEHPMSDTLIAPTLDRKAARAVLQQYVELMDLLRDVERRMARLEPRLSPNSGHPAKVFYGASTAWRARTDNVRTLYEEVERLAVAINLQAL